MRRVGSSLLMLLVVALLALPASSSAADRYSLANGCWTVTGVPGGIADTVFMKPTALGRYMLYRSDRTFVAAGPGGTLTTAAQPSPAADFEVRDVAGGGYDLIPQSTKTAVARVGFTAASGCADFPEASLDATGTPSKGATSFGKVGGIVEGHMHWMAYQYFGGEFRCGQPWHEYGIAYALPDCADREGPDGTAATLQNTLTYGNPAQAHSTSNYPDFPNQAAGNLTYEGMYYRWVQRVWMAGMRVMVMGVNENRVLCELVAIKNQSCNEMDTMRRGFKAIRELESYVDAQAGGPGKGFFQVVTDPFEARKVINSGRLAVILEIETSEPFDCRGVDDKSTCDVAQIDREMDEMNRLGVRSSLLLNKFDNPLTGVRFDSGVASYLINAGNKQSAGVFWNAETCKGKLHDNPIDFGNPTVSAAANTILTGLGLPGGGATPTYPPAPHCNTRGLTELGKHVVNRMMDLHWIVNPDHESQAGVDETLSLLEARNYSGVISPHGWMDPGNWPRLWKLGGLAWPGHSTADSYVKDWQDYRPRETPYDVGWGYGADLGGLSHQPEKSAAGGSITYPFKSYDGAVSFERQKTGNRTFDYTKEGVAHYGLYADWLADLQRLGGPKMADDMWNGAEAYLEMWERASGVRSNRCFFRQDGLKAGGRGPIHLGDTWQQVLGRAGQPQQRDLAWSWCVKGSRNRSTADVAVFSAAGKVQVVGSTADGRNALGVAIGARAPKRARIRSIGGGLLIRPAGTSTYVYAVRKGRVRGVAVTTTKHAAKRAALRADMRRLLRARADNQPKTFVPAAAQADARLSGRAIALDGSASFDPAAPLLCSLNL